MKIFFTLCGSRKYPYSPPQKGLKIPRGGRFSKAQNLSKCMKLDWNFQTGKGGGGGLKKNPFHEGGVDNFWNHTLCKKMCLFHKLKMQLFIVSLTIHISLNLYIRTLKPPVP